MCTFGDLVEWVQVVGVLVGLLVLELGSGGVGFARLGGRRHDIFGDGRVNLAVDLRAGSLTLICLRGLLWAWGRFEPPLRFGGRIY